MAKAPVPGLVKTRLAANVGDEAAARLAAAALLDTLEASRAATGDCVIALTGNLDRAVRSAEIREALSEWTVLSQRGKGFDQRLVRAHLDAADGSLLQIGMDTPQVTAALLLEADAVLTEYDTVLGHAIDGGWWVFGRHRALDAKALRGVPMSTPETGAATAAALAARGLTTGTVPMLRDVDTTSDAEIIAAVAPHTLFAHAWASLGARL